MSLRFPTFQSWSCFGRSLAGFLTVGAISALLSSCDQIAYTRWRIEVAAGDKALAERRDLQDSEKHYQAALEIAVDIDGQEGDRLESLTLPRLWTVKLRQDKLHQAEELLRRNILLERRIYGNDYKQLNYSLESLGGVLVKQDRFKEARPIYYECLALEKRTRSGKSYDLAGTMVSLARVEFNLGNNAAGDSLFQIALGVYRSARLVDPQLPKALDAYAKELRKLGRGEEALPFEIERDSLNRIVIERRRRLGDLQDTTSDTLRD